MKNKTPQLSLILPIRNQATITRPVVTDIIHVLEKTDISFEIVLVENGSTDNTLVVLKQMARQNPRLHVITAPLGYGSAVIAGLSKAKGSWVSYMPSDGQIDTHILPKLVELFRTGKYNMVKIKRTNRESLIRFFRSKIFNMIANFIFGKLPVTDINGSPRIFKRKHLNILQLEYKDSFIDLEFALKARYLGWEIKEIPMNTLPRVGGKSTVSIKTVIEFLRNLLIYRTGEQFGAWKNKIIEK